VYVVMIYYPAVEYNKTPSMFGKIDHADRTSSIFLVVTIRTKFASIKRQ